MMFYVQWHITNKCNLRCAHCYQDDYNSELTFEQLQKIFFDIEDFALNNYKQKLAIALTGGEPFLHKEFDTFLTFLASRESVGDLTVLSNGTLMDRKYAKLLHKCNIKTFQVSIDGGTKDIHDAIRGDGALEKTLSSVSILKEWGINVIAQMVVHKNNIDSVEDLLKLCDEIGIKKVLFTRLVPTGNALKDLSDSLLSKKEHKEFLYKLEEYSNNPNLNVEILKTRQLWRLIDSNKGTSCPVGLTSVSVLADGSVAPCRRMPLTIGNLLEEKFFKIWYGSKILWELRDRNNLKGKCGRCPDKQLCGGCRAIAYGFTNDYLQEDPYCWYEC